MRENNLLLFLVPLCYWWAKLVLISAQHCCRCKLLELEPKLWDPMRARLWLPTFEGVLRFRFKVCGFSVVTLHSNWTPAFDWYMAALTRLLPGIRGAYVNSCRECIHNLLMTLVLDGLTLEIESEAPKSISWNSIRINQPSTCRRPVFRRAPSSMMDKKNKCRDATSLLGVKHGPSKKHDVLKINLDYVLKIFQPI